VFEVEFRSNLDWVLIKARAKNLRVDQETVGAKKWRVWSPDGKLMGMATNIDGLERVINGLGMHDAD